jgi:7-carboxy-7-deazaguanine synthase
LNVIETFASIQGESTHAGKLCFFIRLAGCNLACSYCDTAYAQAENCGTDRSIADLVAEVKASRINLVEITGGEPALQKNTPALAQALLDEGFEVLMETNGSVLLDKFPAGVKRIIDVKLPSSGMSKHNEPGNYQLLKSGDELKFVVGSQEDFFWALDWINRWELDKKNVPLLFSAVFGKVELPELVDWILASKRNYLRFQLQMHKFVWPPDMRGV